MRPDTRVLYSSYLRYKVQLPTSDTEITAGGTKVTLEGPIPLDILAEKYIYT